MRLPTLIIFFLFTVTSCSVKKNNFFYFKALSLEASDSATVFNKGLTSYRYIFYDPVSDSLTYKKLINAVPLQYKYETYAGLLNNADMLDTIRNVMKSLEKYKSGVIDDTTNNDDMSSWPTLYIEYKDDEGVHYYKLLDNVNDTIGNFSWWLFRLEHLKWEKQIVNNNLVNNDAEAVQALKQLGEYDKLEMPYISLPCNSEINFDYLVGKWRSANSSMHVYDILTILKNGNYSIQTIGKKHQSKPFFEKLITNKKDNRFTMINGERAIDYHIVMLSKNCFEYKDTHNTETKRWYRLPE